MLSPRNAQTIALVLTFTFFFGLPSSRISAQTKPQTKPAEAAKQKPDYSQEAVVVEQLSSAYRFERDGAGQREQTLRVKIQSDAGVERFGQLVFDYSSASEKLDMDYVRVRKADGSVVNAAVSDIQDLTAPIAREAPIYTDLRQKHVTVPGLRPGDLLEYRVVWHTQTPLAANHFWMEHNFINKQVIALDDELLVSIPKDSKIKLKTETGFDPSISETADRREYSWKRANLKREDEDKDKEDK